MAERLHTDHPTVPTESILGLLWAAYHRTDRATVQTYRSLLAERDVRGQLVGHGHALQLHRIAWGEDR